MHWTKFKEFAEDKLNVAKMEISVFDRVEGIVGNGENTVYQHFFFLRVIYCQDCLVRPEKK